MKLLDTYRMEMDLPSGTAEVYPCNSTLKLCWKWNDNLCAWRYELDDELIFTDHKDVEHKTFAALYDLEQECDVCYKIEIRLYELCDGAWDEIWKGYLPFRDGDWDVSNCTVRIKPVTIDPFTCILENWKKKVNLLDIPNKVVIDTVRGEVECRTTVGVGTNVPPPPSGCCWSIDTITYVSVQEDISNTIDDYEVIILWCRECLDTAPTDPENWQEEGGKWYRSLTYGGSTTTSTQVIGDIGGAYEVFYYDTTKYFLIDIEITNAVTLQDAIEYMLPDCEYPICSDFLGINPIGDAPNNDEYVCAQKELQRIVLFQASDVIRADLEDAQAATVFKKSFGEWYEDFKKLFNLEMFFDENTECIRIEHVSFQLSIKMLDFTQPKLLPCILGKRRYKYDKQKFPLNIFYKDKIQTSSRDWTDATMRFPIECSDSDLVTQDKTVQLECTISDIAGAYNNRKLEEDNDALQSMIPIALDEFGNIVSGIGDITGDNILNSPFAWANVLKKYHLHNSPQKYGFVNDDEQVFKTTLYQREQTEIEFKMCCADWKLFRPTHGVKTQFGWGLPKKADICRTIPINTVTLTPTFQCD